MNPMLTAEDLWPLVQKLPHDEQVRLAKLALRAAAQSGNSDAETYRVSPPGRDEFSSDVARAGPHPTALLRMRTTPS